MNKHFIASCLIIVAAASLGYWLFSDSAPTPREVARNQTVAPPINDSALASNDQGIPGPNREIVEIIDLSRVFEPTGEELDLQNLLSKVDFTEYLPSPRTVSRPDAAEEESSLPNGLELLKRQVVYLVGRKCAELVNQMQPLKGLTEFEEELFERADEPK